MNSFAKSLNLYTTFNYFYADAEDINIIKSRTRKDKRNDQHKKETNQKWF